MLPTAQPGLGGRIERTPVICTVPRTALAAPRHQWWELGGDVRFFGRRVERLRRGGRVTSERLFVALVPCFTPPSPGALFGSFCDVP